MFMHNDILIKNAMLLPLADGQPATIANGFLAINGATIGALGPMADMPPGLSAAKTMTEQAACLCRG